MGHPLAFSLSRFLSSVALVIYATHPSEALIGDLSVVGDLSDGVSPRQTSLSLCGSPKIKRWLSSTVTEYSLGGSPEIERDQRLEEGSSKRGVRRNTEKRDGTNESTDTKDGRYMHDQKPSKHVSTTIYSHS
ncbi:uncharacterized protein LOC125588625 [Brassica napus]|uniref:uncharacterized protein LOC125588625 n=1 Tax=Brassica napus TaxID=3708 RepID=UPI00207A9799|nr:uncharacterized protein LOC125588625 [Brassica napus]